MREGEVGLHGDGKQVFEAHDENVWESSNTGDSSSKREGSDLGDTLGEEGDDIVISEVEDLGGEDGAVVVDALENQTIGEGVDSKGLEKGGLGGTNLVTLLDQVHVSDNFDGTLVNLGGDTKSLEERGFGRRKLGLTLGNDHIIGGNDTSFGSGRDTRGLANVGDLSEVAVSEDEPNVADEN